MNKQKNAFEQKKLGPGLKFYPGLAIIGLEQLGPGDLFL